MRRAIVAGSAAASFCVEAVGSTRVAQLRELDLAERLSRFRALVHVP